MTHLLICTILALTIVLGIRLRSAAGQNLQTWKDRVPQPVYDDNPDLVSLYWTAWELAHDHLKTQPGLAQSPYMDEAFDDQTIWIWDTCFMVMFCKYAPDEFPGVQSLNNFYLPLHDSTYPPGTFPLRIHHPDNPPLFAWAEHDNFVFVGNTDYVRTLIVQKQYLQKHFEWFDTVQPGWTFQSAPGRSVPTALKKVENGYQWAGVQSGMDNTPRKGGLWIDAIAQQGLSALCISRMADRLGDKAMAQQWRHKYEAIRDTVNKLYWDETDGIYYDIDPRTLEHLKVKTPASYWPMLAEMCTPQQAARMAKLVADPDVFGGERPWTTVARNDPAFTRPDGNYWRGAIWLPTAYMGTKALEKYGYYALADDAAERLLGQMLRTYQNYQPHTIWECYSPTRDSPADHRGRRVRPDFCGWSALGPISLFIENVLGFHLVDAQNRRVEWRLHHAQRHGIRHLRFGDVTTDILYDGHGHVTVTTNAPYTLIINGQSSPIHPGTNTLDANPTDPPNTH